MRSNSLALGDRNYEGKYNRLMIAGDGTITNSDVNKIYCAGDLTISKSTIGKLKFAGDLNANTVTFKEVRGAGDANFEGVCNADKMIMIGDVSCEMLECRILQNGASSEKVKINSNSIPTWRGIFKGETFENFRNLVIDGDLEFNNIILSSPLSIQREISCDKFYLLTGMSIDCINSEYTFILATSNINIDLVTGTNVEIKKEFRPDKNFKSIFKNGKYGYKFSDNSIANINHIEADNIYVENTKCSSVCGVNVIIGDLCIIDRVEYQDSIEISSKALVNEVVKV